MGLSVTQRQHFLSHWRGVQVPAPPANFYLALLTTNPSNDAAAGLVEVTTSHWSNYTRTPIAASTGAWSAPTSTPPYQVHNSAAIDFGSVTTDLDVTVTGAAIYDAATVGTFLAFAGLSGGNRTVSNALHLLFAIGDLVITDGTSVSMGAGVSSLIKASKASHIPSVGEVGVDLDFQTFLDLTATTALQLVMQPPLPSSPITQVLDPLVNIADPGSGIVRYTTQSGDLPVTGAYQAQITDISGSNLIRSPIMTFTVAPALA